MKAFIKWQFLANKLSPKASKNCQKNGGKLPNLVTLAKAKLNKLAKAGSGGLFGQHLYIWNDPLSSIETHIWNDLQQVYDLQSSLGTHILEEARPLDWNWTTEFTHPAKIRMKTNKMYNPFFGAIPIWALWFENMETCSEDRNHTTK